jgi:prepilin-type N-terminal cleavage/methylation domain-containing protein
VTKRGYTFIELMVSLSIFGMIMTSATSLMFGAYGTNRYVQTQNESVQQIEAAMRRMIDNVRSASTVGPNFSATNLDLVTQSDPDNSQLKYDVSYYVNANNQLVETHDLYGTNVILSHVSAFSVTTLQSTKPSMYQVTLTATEPGGKTVTRTCNMTSRNF